jgi:hypothetical protein
MPKKKNEPAVAGNHESAGAYQAAAPATPAAALAPIRPPKKTEMQLRVEFTHPEIVNLARRQAEAYGELSRAEEEKKAVTSQLKAKCDGLASKISELAGKITAGFEYRTVPCEIRFDDPKAGLKSTYRLDTGEVVNVDPMTLTERQAELPLTEGPKGGSITLADLETISGEDASGDYAEEYRNLFVNVDGELSSDAERREQAIGLIREEPAGYVDAFLDWIAEHKPVGHTTALTLIEQARREYNRRQQQKQTADRLAVRSATPGTVECDADEGSRDDAGENSKNDL